MRNLEIDPESIRIIIGVLKGFAYGALAAALIFFKDEDWDEVNYQQLLRVVLIGGIVGGIAGTGTSIDDASIIIGEEFGIPSEVIKTMIMTGITITVDHIVKFIWERLGLKSLWEKLSK